jgi:hypothetical protein
MSDDGFKTYNQENEKTRKSARAEKSVLDSSACFIDVQSKKCPRKGFEDPFRRHLTKTFPT